MRSLADALSAIVTMLSRLDGTPHVQISDPKLGGLHLSTPNYGRGRAPMYAHLRSGAISACWLVGELMVEIGASS